MQFYLLAALTGTFVFIACVFYLPNELNLMGDSVWSAWVLFPLFLSNLILVSVAYRIRGQQLTRLRLIAAIIDKLQSSDSESSKNLNMLLKYSAMPGGELTESIYVDMPYLLTGNEADIPSKWSSFFRSLRNSFSPTNLLFLTNILLLITSLGSDNLSDANAKFFVILVFVSLIMISAYQHSYSKYAYDLMAAVSKFDLSEEELQRLQDEVQVKKAEEEQKKQSDSETNS